MPRAAARSTDIFQDSVLLNSDSEHLNFAARQSHHTPTDMCNFYSLTKGQEAIGEWFRVRHDRTDNLPLFPGIFPDQFAPIVRNGAEGERELVMAC
jgi:hypothetical protein